MDNRINEIRRKISVLRAEMMDLDQAVRTQVKEDRDCTQAALVLIARRKELVVLIGEWKAAGGGDRLPNPQERLAQQARPGPSNAKVRRGGSSRG
jgi:hypothetical protein